MDVDLGQHTLDIAGGGLLASHTAFRLLNGTLTSGGPTSASELIVHVQEADPSEIQANIVDAPNSVVSLVKSGPGPLHLRGNNTYSGTTVVSEGAIYVDQPTALPTGTNVRVTYDGYLSNETAEALRVGHLQIDGGGVSGVNADRITISTGGVSKLVGNGTLQKLGPGLASLTDTRQYSGAIEILEGILSQEPNQVGTSDVVVRRDGKLRFFQGNGTVPYNVLLDGGGLSIVAGTYVRPVSLTKRLQVSDDSVIDVDTAHYLSLDGGLNMAAGAALKKRGAGTLTIKGTAIVGDGTSLDLDEGLVRLDARLQSLAVPSILYLGSTRTDLLDDEILLSIGGNNRTFDGNLVVSSIGVEIQHAYALGSGITTVAQGARLVLRVPEVYGNVVLNGGQLITTESHRFVGSVTNAGDIEPGASPGTLQVEGDFAQQTHGRLVMEITRPFMTDLGYVQPTDLLDVSGTLSLDGTLAVRLLHDFIPAPGDRFELLRFGQLTGEFAEIELPSLPDDRAWSLKSLYSDGELRVVPHVIGDSDRDGFFSSDDMVVVFQAGLYETGQTAAWETGDWNADGFFDSGDMVYAFQAGTYEMGPMALVPEPSAIYAALMAYIATVWSYARRRRTCGRST